MTGEFPKRLTEVFITSDGKIHSNLEAAEQHEMRFELRRRVRQAVSDSKFHMFGEYRSPFQEDYQANLVEQLIRQGVRAA